MIALCFCIWGLLAYYFMSNASSVCARRCVTVFLAIAILLMWSNGEAESIFWFLYAGLSSAIILEVAKVP